MLGDYAPVGIAADVVSAEVTTRPHEPHTAVVVRARVRRKIKSGIPEGIPEIISPLEYPHEGIS